MTDETVAARTSALQALVECRLPLGAAIARVRSFGWDSDEDLVTLRASHVMAVLRRFLAGELSADHVEVWADGLEVREDIGFAGDTLDLIFRLANPDMNGAITPSVAEALIAKYDRGV